MSFEMDKNSYSRYLGRGFNLAIEISHSELDTFYLINDITDITIDSQEYQAFPFDIVLPSQNEKQGTQLIMSNINQLVTNELINIVTSNENMIVKVYIVNVESETAEKYDKGTFEIMSAEVTQEQVNFSINLRHSLDYNVGTKRYNQQLFGNLFL
jgi:hypothetical protein